MSSPVDNLHTPIVLSRDPDAKYCSSGENTMLFIPKECPVKVLMGYPFCIHHTRIVSSSDAEAKYFPLEENTTLVT